MVEQLFLGDVFDAMVDRFGYDQRALSTCLGLTQGAISALSSQQVNAAEARQLCEAVGLDLADVISRFTR